MISHYLCEMKYFFLANIVKRKLLRDVSSDHKGRYVPLASAKRIGFIFDASEPDIDKGIEILVKTLDSKGIAYKAAYVDFRKKKYRRPLSVKSSSIVLLNRKNRKWNGLPAENVFRSFVSEPFDIIIDLTQSRRVTPLEYLFSASQAAFRIGVYPNRYLSYDMAVTKDNSGNKNDEEVPLSELVSNIIKYLTFIQSV